MPGEVVEERVVIGDLADDLGVRKQRIFKILPRLGISTSMRREVSRGNQLVATVSAQEASRIRREVETYSSESVGDQSVNGAAIAPSLGDDVGYFYLIQLEPEIDQGRFKVGFTTDLDGRLQKHRCSAPFARYRQSWLCRRTWERAAIDCCTSAAEKLHTEVFRAADLAPVATRLAQFFAFMPSLSAEAPDADIGAATNPHL